MTIKDYSSTAASNTTINGIGIQGTNNVRNFDDAFRNIMADIADWTDSDTVASGSTTDLGSVPGMYVTVSGTSTITSFGTLKAGMVKFVYFSGAGQITHNSTSMVLAGGVSITRAAGDIGIFVSEGSGNWRCLNYFYARSAPIAGVPKGYRSGLGISNSASDATNDLDIAAGEATSTANGSPSLVTLASSITKRTDAAWAVGSGNGGWLDGSAMPDGTGHVWLLQRSDTGVVDVGFSAGLSFTLPTNYDRYVRIGSFLRESGAIVLGTWANGNRDFVRKNQKQERDSTSGTASTTQTFSVPNAIRCQPIVSSQLSVAASSNVAVYLGNGDAGVADLLVQQITTPAGVTARDVSVASHAITNTNRQLYLQILIASGSITGGTLYSHGWRDLDL